jgi:hypothetical protein
VAHIVPAIAASGDQARAGSGQQVCAVLAHLSDGTMTQAAYIKAYPDLAGSRQNVSKNVQNVYQINHPPLHNRLTTG